jgi:hypothetical protein
MRLSESLPQTSFSPCNPGLHRPCIFFVLIRYGYLKDPNDKNKIIIDPETAPIVRRIFEWKAAGLGNAQICRKLIDMGVSAPNKYRLEKALSRTHATPTAIGLRP